MTEFVQKKLEDLRPIFEQMKKLELFSEHEIRGMIKKFKEHEYKLQRHTKSKEDYLLYIQYGLDLMKLIKQRREKHGIVQKKSEIDFAIANKINHLYKETTDKFQDDFRFWISYMTFCKHVKFHDCINRMIGRMLQVHQNKPKCWYIAARWEMEENDNSKEATNLLLKGLQHHPDSQLLYIDLFKLKLDDAYVKNPTSDLKKESLFVIYEQAANKIKDIKFIIRLLKITQKYENTEKLQQKIVSDIVKEYPHEPLMWDTMAHREYRGLIRPTLTNDQSIIEVNNVEESSVRERIGNCYMVYQDAVKEIQTEEMWSLFIDCMFEINEETEILPNCKRKHLKNALLQGHRARKLNEKYYLSWIDMLNTNQISQDSAAQSKLYEVLCWATEALPESKSLWYAKLQYLFSTDQEDLATDNFKKAVDILGKNSIPLWKLRLLHMQSKDPKNLDNFFHEALNSEHSISNYMKPFYIEWIVLTKDINAARKVYDKLCLHSPPCLELHKKMSLLELLQPEISLPHARKPHEMSTLQFGKENIDVWMDFIYFEMKHGEAVKVSNIHNRARKTLKSSLTQRFVTKYNLFKANPRTLGSSV